MDEKQSANTTALPIDDRPEMHQAADGSGKSAPSSLEQDKEIRDGSYLRPDDERMKDLPDESGFSSGANTQQNDERGTKVDTGVPEGHRTPGSAEGERDPARQSD
jgi:hypothetical protein